jgi:ATP-dependent DNA ligase/SAM-dependent methyltransferase
LIYELGKIEYAITDKADGERYILFISNDKNIYIIDNNLKKIMKTNIKSKLYSGTVIDGELITRKDGNGFIFLAFDILAVNNKDLRGDKTQLLKIRLNRLNHVIESIKETITENDEKYYTVKMKRYYYKNIFLGAKKIMDDIKEMEYENDGFIYTPMNECYPLNKKWKTLLKWKPAEMNSVDFYAVKENNNWNLYVQHYNSKNPKSFINELVLFDVNKLCGEQITDTTTFTTQIPEDMKDPITNEPYQTNTVIEFKWDILNKKWIPLRTRWDKTVNPTKFGNFSSVACNIWNSIHNPILLSDLYKYKNVKESNFFFQTMRTFHNNIKKELYDKYLKNTEHLLELCSGKCGDLHKWIHTNIKNVDGFDYCKDSQLECKKRINNINPQLNQRFKFYTVDLTDYNLNLSMFGDDKYDNACCHFALHYFLKSNNSLNNLFNILNKSLKSNGLFICTFMDNKELYKLFNTKTTKSYEIENEVIYYLKRYDFSNPEFNNKIDIYLNGQNYLSSGSNEFIIDYDKLLQRFHENGYELVESKLFKDLYKNNEMTDYEKDISFLNRYCVFKSTKKPSSKIASSNSNNIIINFSNSDDFSNLEMFKLYTIQDISNILNINSDKLDNIHNIKNDEIITIEILKELFKNDIEIITQDISKNISKEELKKQIKKVNKKILILNVVENLESLGLYWITIDGNIYNTINNIDNNQDEDNKKNEDIIKEFPILYKNERKWKIKVYDNIIETEYGQNKMTKTQTIIKGKNIGKRNETSDNEQALKEAQQKWLNKIKEGYKELKKQNEMSCDKTQDKVEMQQAGVMLAKIFEEKRINFPCYVQPKLDGYRMYWSDNKMYSRTGKEFTSLENTELHNELKKINIELDGELYVHGMLFEDYGVLRKQKNINIKDKEKLNNMEYHVYDIRDNTKTFKQRNEILKTLTEKYNKIKIVKTFECNNIEEIYKYHQEFIEMNYEGTIVRNDKQYEFKRTNNLMKLKDFDDEEFEIVNYGYEKKEKDGDKLVMWQCITKDGKTFNVRQAGDEETRVKYYKEGDKYIGRKLCVKFFGYTNDGLPRFPVTKSKDSIRDEIW